MKRIRVVFDWASRFIEFGPQAARGDAARFLDEVSAAMRRGGDVGELLDELADDVFDLCVSNLVQAPPGLHGRLLAREGYRKRLPWMRTL